MASAFDDEAVKEDESTPATAQKTPPKQPSTPQDEIKAVASKLSGNPVQNLEPGVWGVLTAISKNARQRPQGLNIVLSGDEHCIGRLVRDTRFQIADAAVSANHCKIYREKLANSDGQVSPELCVRVFLKDSSTNGTFLNWKKIRKTSPEVRLQHGDIISFVAPPHEEVSYAFVYREVSTFVSPAINGTNTKRKLEDISSANKRTKGIGIGAADGPVSLDDVRSLQRSNMELRNQIENHVGTIENLRSEKRAMIAHHENELSEVKESTAKSYIHQIDNLKSLLKTKEKELAEMNAVSTEFQSSIKDLNERLSASMQSRADSAAIIDNQKSRISELEVQMDEERNQRREERDKAALDLQCALQKIREEAREEINCQAEVHFKQCKEQEEVINKLQDSEKESRILVDTLRSKLDDGRESLIMSEKKVRQLELEIHEKHTAFENEQKRAEEMGTEVERLRKELESEKVAREEAWAKVSALELAIAAATHELSIEKQRFQGARERIILRETQLRAFYSTTEEISALFKKQQKQLKAMQKTLEDEENCDMSIGFDLNTLTQENIRGDLAHPAHKMTGKSVADLGVGETPGSSQTRKRQPRVVDSANNNSSSTEKHDCQIETQEANSGEGVENTQDMECTSTGKQAKGFGSDINGIGTALVLDGEASDTARVHDTESPLANVGADEQNTPFYRIGTLAGETMQLDEDAQAQDNTEQSHRSPERGDGCPPSRLEDTENEAVRTADLLTSEIPGSWAINTDPSIHGENFLRSQDSAHGTSNAVAATGKTGLVDTQAEESQTNDIPSVAPRLTNEHLALNNMIGIVAPDRREQFQIGSVGVGKNESISDAETEDDSNERGCSASDSEDDDNVESTGDPDGDMIADSVG